jgi:hypothetical protein
VYFCCSVIDVVLGTTDGMSYHDSRFVASWITPEIKDKSHSKLALK